MSDLTVAISLSIPIWLILKSWNERLRPAFQGLAFTGGVPLTSRELLKICGLL